jgi:hypothetical protein
MTTSYRFIQRVPPRAEAGSICSELQETSVKLNQIREELQSVGEKLQYTAIVRSQLARGASNQPEIAIIRKGETADFTACIRWGMRNHFRPETHPITKGYRLLRGDE